MSMSLPISSHFLVLHLFMILLLIGCTHKREELSVSQPAVRHTQSDIWLMNTLPASWEIKVHGYGKDSSLIEAAPKEQNVEQWQELITSQIYHEINTTPEKFLRVWSDMLEEVCDGFIAEPFLPGELANNYKVLYWQQFCPETPKEKRPEFSLVKAAADDQRIYILKRSWRYIPTKDQLMEAMTWLNLSKVTVCQNCLEQH